MQIFFKNFIATIALAASLLPSLVHAMLGGDAPAAQAEGMRMKASLRVLPSARFTVHELTLPHGTVVREYVSPRGTIFAVSWNGPVKPDLRTLLGPYFDRYLEAAPNTHGAHAAVAIAKPDLVMRSAGHMRAFSGHAYLPGMMPAGVSADDLQANAGDLP